jgi:hypothetical protein
MKQHSRIKHWDDERHLGHGIIVTLAYGFAFYAHEDENVAEHVRGFDTVKEAIARVRSSYLCACGRCIRKGGG